MNGRVMVRPARPPRPPAAMPPGALLPPDAATRPRPRSAARPPGAGTPSGVATCGCHEVRIGLPFCRGGLAWPGRGSAPKRGLGAEPQRCYDEIVYPADLAYETSCD